MNEIELKVKDVLKESIEFENKTDIDCLGPEDDLLVLGMNSITFLKVVVALEDTFDIEMDEDELNIENFRTIKSIVAHIEKEKQRATLVENEAQANS
jgi:acyl carrier protein